MKRITLARPSARTVKWTAASVIILAGFAVLSLSMTSQTTERAAGHLERGDAEAALHELKHAGPFLYFSAKYHALCAKAHQLLGDLDSAEASMQWALWLDDDEGEYFQIRSQIRRALSSRDEYKARELGYHSGRSRRGYQHWDNDFNDMTYDGRYDDGAYGHGDGDGEYPAYEDDMHRHSRWEQGAIDDMSLWNRAEEYHAEISEQDLEWMDELDRLADTVREEQSQRSWAIPRMLTRYTSDSFGSAAQ